jgi:hypothetical protein
MSTILKVREVGAIVSVYEPGGVVVFGDIVEEREMRR